MVLSNKKVLTYDTINPNVKTMEYAVRGPIVIRAVEIEKELAQVILNLLRNPFNFRAFHIPSKTSSRRTSEMHTQWANLQ